MKNTRAFTLTELLVAIAIVAVLSFILFPLISSSIEKANQANCASHQRQVVTAMIAFSNDHGGQLVKPMGQFLETEEREKMDDYRLWSDALVSYFEKKSWDSGKLDERPHDTLSCPSSEQVCSNGARSDYGINSRLTPATNSSIWMSQIIDPARTIAIADAGIGTAYCTRTVSATSGLDFRHSGQANVAFLDGHVEALMPEEIPMDYREYPWAYNP